MNAADAQDYAGQRARMVAEVEAMYAATRGDTGLASMSPQVRAAMAKVERHRFVPAGQQSLAYRNHPLPIGSGQTISQPYIVALSTDLAAPRAGQAVLAEIAGRVYTVELIESLGREAAARLSAAGYANVEVRIGDGYAGWPEKAPFDAIVVTAAAPRVPEALLGQLKPGGRMVIPVGATHEVQELRLLVKRADGGIEQRSVLPVRFVPLVPGK